MKKSNQVKRECLAELPALLSIRYPPRSTPRRPPLGRQNIFNSRRWLLIYRACVCLFDGAKIISIIMIIMLA